MREIRNHQINFVVNETEYRLIKDKMGLMGILNLSGYLRKMAIDGYIINFDIPELKEIIRLLRYASNNINQIAMNVNATGVIYQNEINEIQEKQSDLWKLLNTVEDNFSKLK